MSWKYEKKKEKCIAGEKKPGTLKEKSEMRKEEEKRNMAAPAPHMRGGMSKCVPAQGVLPQSGKAQTTTAVGLPLWTGGRLEDGKGAGGRRETVWLPASMGGEEQRTGSKQERAVERCDASGQSSQEELKAPWRWVARQGSRAGTAPHIGPLDRRGGWAEAAVNVGLQRQGRANRGTAAIGQLLWAPAGSPSVPCPERTGAEGKTPRWRWTSVTRWRDRNGGTAVPDNCGLDG